MNRGIRCAGCGQVADRPAKNMFPAGWYMLGRTRNIGDVWSDGKVHPQHLGLFCTLGCLRARLAILEETGGPKI